MAHSDILDHPPGVDGETPPAGGLVFPVVIFLMSRLAIVFLLPGMYSDTQLYCGYAIKGVDLNEIPYRDFDIEYPPVSYWAIALPRLVSQIPYPKQRIDSEVSANVVRDYRRTFMLEMGIAETGAFLFFLLLIRRLRPELQSWAAWGYCILGLALAPVLYDRLDAGLLLFLMVWFYAAVRASDTTPASLGWDILASVSLGLAIGYKWAPIVMTPYYLFGIVQTPGRWKRTMIVGGVLTLCAGLPFLVHMPRAGMGVWGFLDFHAHRTTEVESLYASTMIALRSLNIGSPIQAVVGMESCNLAGPWADWWAKLSLLILLALYMMLGSWAWLCRGQYDRTVAIQSGGLALLFTVTFSKVLSAQYFVWLAPLILVMGSQCLSYGRFVALTILLLAMTLITTWIFPFNFMQVQHPRSGQLVPALALLQGLEPMRAIHPLTGLVLALRNAVLLLVTLWLGWRVLARNSRAAA